ncbi:hypothetical protein TcasGA2_TC008105 [Tribolium castaneum]|uniref:Uncharacterized protein n=1 Tax=Tribolium castaneum TaxID=7070 RepID=D1ZZT9_TRICA|nr:hypothetical protein TcasGA2_TC008105 [Tribolium castaneum]
MRFIVAVFFILAIATAYGQMIGSEVASFSDGVGAQTFEGGAALSEGLGAASVAEGAMVGDAW